MSTILNFEKWKNLYEQASQTATPSPVGQKDLFMSELLAGASLVKPFISKTKPGFIVRVSQPIGLNNDKTAWSLVVNAYRINSANGTAKMFDSAFNLNLPSTHPSMKNKSTIPNTFSIEGNPAPADATLPKGSQLEQPASNTLADSMSNYSVFQLYGSLAESNISPEEYINLLDSAAPGTKAKMIEMAKSKTLAAAPTKFTEVIRDPNVKKLYDLVVSQS